jgi:hypothetical protein
MNLRYLPNAPFAAGSSEARFIGDLMGSYLLASRARSLSTVQVFACRARSISPYEAVVHAPVAGEPGEALSVTFDTIGLLHGRVQRQLEGGFVIALEVSATERVGLASRIAWLKRHRLRQVDERRQHKRVLPRQPRARLTLGNGQQVECMIIDMSASGVAISADVAPPLGMPVIIGEVPGRVVRHLPHGFAVQFGQAQPLQTLEPLVTQQAGAQTPSPRC